MNWHLQAACRDHPHPNSWFPARGALSQANREALRVCAECPVQQPCLQHAVDTHAEGIWGGMTAKERMGLVRCGPKTTIRSVGRQRNRAR